jgi:ABC-type glycerol-3-phosphate transport system substrate-binding protein
VPFLESLWSAGGSVYAQGKSGLSQPPAAEALRFVLGLRDAGLADPSVLGQPEACVAALARGDVTMTVASSFEVTTLKRAGKSIGVAPVPGKSGPLSLRSGDVLVVFPKYAAAKRAAIAALLDFLTGPEVQGQRAAALGSVPVRRSVSEKTLINPGLEMAFAASRSTPLDGIWGEAEYELNRYLALAYLWRPQPL